MIKRILAVFLAIAIIMCLNPIGVFAAPSEPVITLSKVQAEKGGTVSVTVSITNNPGIWGMDLRISYDKSVLTLDSVDNGDFFSSSEWTKGNLTGEVYILSYEASELANITTESGTLATLNFSVNDTAADGDYTITASYNAGDIINIDFDDINFSVENGTVTVCCLHTNKTEVPSKSASCTVSGNNLYYTCDSCGMAFKADGITQTTVDAETIPAAGHDYGDADCTTPKTCKSCGVTDGNALGHSFTTYVSNNDATCTLDGTKTAKCDRCTETDTIVDIGSAVGHDYAAATCTAPKTCKVCNATEGTALGHSYSTDWSRGEDSHWHECSTCGNKIDQESHDYGDEDDKCLICEYERTHVHRLTLVPAKEATCTESGNKAYYTCSGCENWFEDASGTVLITDKTSVVVDAFGHDFTAATCTTPKTCKVCVTTDGEALGHSFTNYVSNNDATCTEDGTKTAKCDRCDETDTVTDVGSAKGHDYADATCTAPKTCQVCGATDGEALSHSYAAAWSTGEDGHWHECEACGDKIDQAVHDYGDGDKCVICEYERAHVHRLTLISAKEATCTESGNKAYYTCSGCENWFEDASGTVLINDKTSVVIDALDHDMSEATCTEAAVCQRKGCAYTDGEALGHTYEETWSCDAENHWHKCSRCDAVTDVAAHIPGTEATEETAQTCTICGYEIAPELGHTHKLTKVEVTVTCTEAGNKEYYVCECGKWFADAEGTVEITDKDSVKSEALGHTDANKDNKCDMCGAQIAADEPADPNNPQTGDNSSIFLWIIFAIVSFIGMMWCIIAGRKRNIV